MREWRAVAAVFVVCAFFLQGFAAQTHIHGAFLSPQSGAAAMAKGDGKAIDSAVQQSGRDHAPSPADPNDCPFCQAALHATGLFSAVPAALAPAAMYFASSAFLIFTQTVHVLYRGHDKEKRGPPGI